MSIRLVVSLGAGKIFRSLAVTTVTFSLTDTQWNLAPVQTKTFFSFQFLLNIGYCQGLDGAKKGKICDRGQKPNIKYCKLVLTPSIGIG